MIDNEWYVYGSAGSTPADRTIPSQIMSDGPFGHRTQMDVSESARDRRLCHHALPDRHRSGSEGRLAVLLRPRLRA
jgi:hypothetical protein